jgi:hypothetical protein
MIKASVAKSICRVFTPETPLSSHVLQNQEVS